MAHRPEPISISSVSNRVSKLETNVEVLSNRLTVLADDIAASDKKQDAFFSEWRSTKEQERKDHDALARARQTTPRDLIMMLAACVTMCAALAAFGNYIIQTSIARATSPLEATLSNVPAAIAAAVDPLTERQNAASQASLQQRDSIERITSALTDVRGRLTEVQRVATDNRSISLKTSDRAVQNEIDIGKLSERITSEQELRELADKALRGHATPLGTN